jgi:hypothetical protein
MARRSGFAGTSGGDAGGNRRALYSSRRASSGNMIGIPSRIG